VSESTGGAVVHSFYFDQIVSGPNGCGIRQATEPSVWLFICQSGLADNPLTVLFYANLSGEVTYFSIGYDLQWHRSEDGTVTTDSSYSWNVADGSRSGTPARWGSTYSIDVALTSADAIYQGPLTASIQTVENTSNNIPWECFERNTADWGWERFCGDSTDEWIELAGFAEARRNR
jgi:hypothetical protein